MKNLLLKPDVFNNLVEMLKDAFVIAAMVVTALGIAIICISTKVAKVVRKTNEVPQNDPVKITMRIVGICMILLGLVVILISCVTTLAGV